MIDLTAVNMLTLAMGAVLWIIMFIIVVKSKFHNPKHKTIWILLFIFCPPAALLFPFIGMKQTK